MIVKESRRVAAKEAMIAALKLRNKYGRNLFHPIDIFKVAEDNVSDVRFVDLNSLEGMYAKKPMHVLSLALHLVHQKKSTIAERFEGIIKKQGRHFHQEAEVLFA